MYEYQAVSVNYLGSFISQSIRKIQNGGKDQQRYISPACGKITQKKKKKKTKLKNTQQITPKNYS